MEKRISATQAVREFSDLLNRIKFKGEHYVIERSGKPVAQMRPVKEMSETRTLKELKYLLRELPGLDDELNDFAADVEAMWKDQPFPPNRFYQNLTQNLRFLLM